MTYEATEKILFAADGFGKFGALDVEEEWANEARRYYIGIVGKYGPQVQAVLKKAAGLDIQTICSLHGPVHSCFLKKISQNHSGIHSEGIPVHGTVFPGVFRRAGITCGTTHRCGE